MKKLCHLLCFMRHKFDPQKLNEKKEISLFISPEISKKQALPEPSNESLNSNEEETFDIDNDDVIFPLNYFKESEKTLKFSFTKKSIISYIENELSETNDYKEFFNKEDMVLSMKKKGSIFSSSQPLIKMKYSLPVSSFPKGTTIQYLDFVMNDVSERSKWDKTLQKYEKIEGDNSIYILHYITTKPMMFVSEREVVDKRYDFYQDGAFYDFSSSVEDNFIPENPNAVRVNDIFSGFKMYIQGECFVFESLTQVDLKMNAPQGLFNITMPKKLKDWYGALRAHCKATDDEDDEMSNINKK